MTASTEEGYIYVIAVGITGNGFKCYRVYNLNDMTTQTLIFESLLLPGKYYKLNINKIVFRKSLNSSSEFVIDAGANMFFTMIGENYFSSAMISRMKQILSTLYLASDNDKRYLFHPIAQLLQIPDKHGSVLTNCVKNGSYVTFEHKQHATFENRSDCLHFNVIAWNPVPALLVKNQFAGEIIHYENVISKQLGNKKFLQLPFDGRIYYSWSPYVNTMLKKATEFSQFLGKDIKNWNHFPVQMSYEKFLNFNEATKRVQSTNKTVELIINNKQIHEMYGYRVYVQVKCFSCNRIQNVFESKTCERCLLDLKLTKTWVNANCKMDIKTDFDSYRINAKISQKVDTILFATAVKLNRYQINNPKDKINLTKPYNIYRILGNLNSLPTLQEINSKIISDYYSYIEKLHIKVSPNNSIRYPYKFELIDIEFVDISLLKNIKLKHDDFKQICCSNEESDIEYTVSNEITITGDVENDEKSRTSSINNNSNKKKRSAKHVTEIDSSNSHDFCSNEPNLKKQKINLL